MEPAGRSTVVTDHHAAVPPHDAHTHDAHDAHSHDAHDAHTHDAHDEFYAVSNPKYFGLPLGVLLAASVSAIAVGITLLKFFGAFL